jgi:hypothetical protein
LAEAAVAGVAPEYAGHPLLITGFGVTSAYDVPLMTAAAAIMPAAMPAAVRLMIFFILTSSI